MDTEKKDIQQEIQEIMEDGKLYASFCNAQSQIDKILHDRGYKRTFRFVEQDVDGYGGNAEIMITVLSKEPIPNGTRYILGAEIEKLKKEWGEWDTDEIAMQACRNRFPDAQIQVLLPDGEILF